MYKKQKAIHMGTKINFTGTKTNMKEQNNL
jgi:hypothetical protein